MIIKESIGRPQSINGEEAYRLWATNFSIKQALSLYNQKYDTNHKDWAFWRAAHVWGLKHLDKARELENFGRQTLTPPLPKITDAQWDEHIFATALKIYKARMSVHAILFIEKHNLQRYYVDPRFYKFCRDEIKNDLKLMNTEGKRKREHPYKFTLFLFETIPALVAKRVWEFVAPEHSERVYSYLSMDARKKLV